jgi:hypothetical protein
MMEPQARLIGFQTVEGIDDEPQILQPPPRPQIHQPVGPPIRANRRREVLRLKGNQQFKGWVLSKAWWSCTVHYNPQEKRTQPCLERERGCEGCLGEMSRRDLWYLNALNSEQGNCWIEFPQDSAAAIRDMLGGFPSYRGLQVKFYRSQSDKGVIRAELLNPEPMDGRRLPEAETPLETLWKLWTFKRPGRTFQVPLTQG